MSDSVLELRGVCRSFQRGRERIEAVREVSLRIARRARVAIVGPSGSGKTTLLQIMGCLDRPNAGAVLLDGEDISRLVESQVTRLRARRIGFVFQSFHLQPTLTALENVLLPALFAGNRNGASRARELLALVGLETRLHHRPGELSGGEMQRVAVARALINDPGIVFADEPTGSLDSTSAAPVIDGLFSLAQRDLTLVLVTHNNELARRADLRFVMRDGRLTQDA